MPRIDRFIDGYDFLSNYYEHKMWYKNVLWESSEHAYQAEKTTDEDEREDIRCAPTPNDAKQMCKPGKLAFFRPDWDQVKVGIMEEIVRAKFTEPSLRRMLLDTKDYELIEGNYWHDNFWGNCSCGKKAACQAEGQNHLGNILMKIREEIRNESAESRSS